MVMRSRAYWTFTPSVYEITGSIVCNRLSLLYCCINFPATCATATCSFTSAQNLQEDNQPYDLESRFFFLPLVAIQFSPLHAELIL